VAKTLTGTRIRFWPDRQIFVRGTQLNFEALAQRARQTASLVPGLSVRVQDARPASDRSDPSHADLALAGFVGADYVFAEHGGEAARDASGGPVDGRTGHRRDQAGRVRRLYRDSAGTR